MAFEAFEKIPQVAPLLVRLYDTHNLYSLARDKDSQESCAELTTIMTDLMSIKLSDKESELIADVLLALMKQAQKDLKLALSERLAVMENVPLRMVLSMANDDIEIADPILRQSPVLHDMDLIYILQAKGVEHGRSIAQRSGLSAAVINLLADTKDFETAVYLSENDGITLTEHAYTILSDMAKYSDKIATPLLSREDLPQEVAGKLYQFVSDELKSVLRDRFGMASEAVVAALEDITIEMVTAEPPRDVSEQFMTHAHSRKDRGELKFANITASLRRGQLTTFLAQFSVYCGLPAETVKEMMRQESGQKLAIACRAMDVTKPDFVSLYLLTDRFRSTAKRVINHKELSRIMTMYDEIDPQEARRVIAAIRH